MRKESLTGRSTHRIQTRFLRKPVLVLMVEVRATGYNTYNAGGRVESDPYDYTYWRDATASDLLLRYTHAKAMDTISD